MSLSPLSGVYEGGLKWGGISIGGSPAAPNPGANTERSAEIARQGQIGNRSVSIRGSGSVNPIGEVVQLDNATVATPTSERSVGLVPEDNPTTLPISWFAERRLLPSTKLDGMYQNSGSVSL